MGFSTIRDDSILLRSGRLRRTKETQKFSAVTTRMCGCAADEKAICLTEIRHHIGDPLNIQARKLLYWLRLSCLSAVVENGRISRTRQTILC